MMNMEAGRKGANMRHTSEVQQLKDTIDRLTRDYSTDMKRMEKKIKELEESKMCPVHKMSHSCHVCEIDKLDKTPLNKMPTVYKLTPAAVKEYSEERWARCRREGWDSIECPPSPPPCGPRGDCPFEDED
tara:strand:- start:83 stop:472 length:390 start_codon:yes stop_codon:yes gene_type:complete